jgi:serine/threonine-protein kinase HipA
MPESVKLIKVNFHNTLVGLLALGPDRCCVFEYDKEWLQKGFSISPFYLPLKPGLATARANPFGGLFGVFYDSLPDGWGKLLMDRWLKKQGFDPFSISMLDRLAFVGNHGMGALTYQPDKSLGISMQQHSLDYYAAEVEKILQNEDSTSLDELLKTACSSAGARPKVMVNIEGKDWLVKFRALYDPSDIGRIEYEHSLMARRCGIEMPETRLFQEKYFGVRRFDRDGDMRFHVHSAAGLLYASHRLPSLDYSGLMKATLALTRDMSEAEKMFRQMVFNVLIGNRDDHARNFSFIYTNSTWKLAPAYDLLPSEGFGGQHTTTVNGKGNPDINDCMEVAREVGFPHRRAKEILEQVQAGISTSDCEHK